MIFMVYWDYFIAGRQINNNYFFLMFVGIFLAVSVYGHSSVVDDNMYSKLIFPLSWKGFSYVLHILFLAVLTILKEKSYEFDYAEKAKVIQVES